MKALYFGNIFFLINMGGRVLKRNLLFVLVLIFAIFLTACGSSESKEAEGSSDGTKLDILSWWTAGGEADALNSILEGFEDEYPDITIENSAVAGGGGANSQAVLSTRLQGGDPPAVFQAQGGPDLLRWQSAGYLDSLDDLYEENGWLDVFPEELIEMNSKDGHIYGLPMNVHRNNVIWYNKKVFEENNIEPPKSFEEFFEIAEILESNDIIPLALGNKTPRWATLVFESALLNEFGADGMAELWTGDVDFDSPEMRNALETFSKMLDYTNDNHSALDWQDAAELVINEEAAMHIMGDWESGFFESKNLEPEVDYGWIPTPSSEDIFNVVNDSMGMPADLKNPEEAEKFVSYLGSEDAQRDFNELKGSIPARTDVDLSDFGTYSQSTAEDFKNFKISISLAGGSATSAGFISKVDDIVNEFVTQRNIDNFIDSLNQARPLLDEEE